MKGFKVLTHDYRPPIQGGEAVWDGKRKTLDKVDLDTGPYECAAGWNFCADAATAFRISGLWPNGRPSVLLAVKGSADTVVRGNKMRCSKLTILERCDETAVAEAVRELSTHFGKYADRMAQSQMNWRTALARLKHDVCAVEEGILTAISTRNLTWSTHRYDNTRDVQDAWAAWAARDAWDAWAAWYARAAWAARDAWDAWAVRDAWAARAARDARDVRDAWAARAALTVEFASLQKLIDRDPLFLTTGLRDAYENGIGIALPTGPNELGWAMINNKEMNR